MKKNNHDITQHLTQTDLLDYTNGVLSNEEMYRLELHINECELCNDALEGIALIKNKEHILDSLSSKIAPVQKNEKGINYMLVAASIALVAVCSISYWLITKPSVNTIALNETTDALEAQPTETTKEEVPSTSPTEIIVEPITAEEEPARPINEGNKTNLTSKPATTIPTKMEASKQKITRSSNEIESVDEPSPIAAVAVQEKEKQQEETGAEDEIVEAADAESDVSLSEVVVTESASRKSKRSKKSSALKANTVPNQKEPIPVGGIAALKMYTEKNLQYPQKALDNNVKGTVVLNVSINSDGSINAITVVKGLGFGCDAEAKRLIASGPKWTPKVENGEAVKASRQVKIKFKK